MAHPGRLNRYSIAVVLSGCVVLSCGASSNVGTGGPPLPSLVGQTISIPEAIPYDESAVLPQYVIDECDALDDRQAEFIVDYAQERGINVVRDEAAVRAGTGKVLDVKIVGLVSRGNAFIGHSKQVALRGRLLEDGTEVAGFTAVRSSSGGFGAGFKSSCAVLDRCVQTLGQDIAGWLDEPRNGQRLGEGE